MAEPIWTGKSGDARRPLTLTEHDDDNLVFTCPYQWHMSDQAFLKARGKFRTMDDGTKGWLIPKSKMSGFISDLEARVSREAPKKPVPAKAQQGSPAVEAPSAAEAAAPAVSAIKIRPRVQITTDPLKSFLDNITDRVNALLTEEEKEIDGKLYLTSASSEELSARVETYTGDGWRTVAWVETFNGALALMDKPDQED